VVELGIVAVLLVVTVLLLLDVCAALAVELVELLLPPQPETRTALAAKVRNSDIIRPRFMTSFLEDLVRRGECVLLPAAEAANSLTCAWHTAFSMRTALSLFCDTAILRYLNSS
jgi:hypothetical protein